VPRPASMITGYDALRAGAPEAFGNPPGAAFEILTDPVLREQAAASVASLLRRDGLPPESGGIGLLYRDQYIALVRDAVRFRDGSIGGYLRILPAGPPGAAILPLIGDRVALLRHFRHATRQWHWEIPRGFGMPGESASQTARRELAEEIGADAAELVPLGSLDADTGLSSARAELFLARSDRAPAAETLEGVDSVRLIGLPEFGRMIRDGDITDSFTIAAFARARTRDLI
jgi:ADP-ribose pyrophosphatase